MINRLKLKLLAFISILLISLVGSRCSHDYITGKSSYNWFGINSDIGLGKEVMYAQEKSFEDNNVALDNNADPDAYPRLQTIVKRISQVSHVPDFPYEVHLANSPVVNAWCAPGGKVMVFTGLWDPKKGLVNKESDDEIAAVLAHEIAHATARHVTKQLSQNMTIMMAGTVASSAIAVGASQTASNIFGEFFSTGFNIYAPTYSRKNEAEADRIGLFYMAKAGYDPRAAVEVWKRAATKKGEPYTIYASHPANGERAKQLELLLPQAITLYEHPELTYPSFAKPKPVKVQTADFKNQTTDNGKQNTDQKAESRPQ